MQQWLLHASIVDFWRVVSAPSAPFDAPHALKNGAFGGRDGGDGGRLGQPPLSAQFPEPIL
jgi:hypothetical protein